MFNLKFRNLKYRNFRCLMRHLMLASSAKHCRKKDILEGIPHSRICWTAQNCFICLQELFIFFYKTFNVGWRYLSFEIKLVCVPPPEHGYSKTQEVRVMKIDTWPLYQNSISEKKILDQIHRSEVCLTHLILNSPFNLFFTF